MQYISFYNSPLGKITLVSDGKSLTGLWFEGQKYYPDNLNEANEKSDLQIFKETKRWLDIYFSEKIPNFTPQIFFEGTSFQKKVWELLLTIPYGKTKTYGEIAKQISEKCEFSKTSARAVGGAVGHNKISIIVPCHRIVGVNGNLTGYAGGIERKIKLLELEKIKINNFSKQ